MSNENDTTAAVKEFMELWQQQFSYVLQGREGVDFFKEMQQNSLQVIKECLNGKYPDATDANSSDDADDEVAGLNSRIAELEEQLRQLERSPKRKGSKAA